MKINKKGVEFVFFSSSSGLSGLYIRTRGKARNLVIIMYGGKDESSVTFNS